MHHVDYSIDPDKEFVPSNYLVSPFNSTPRFLNGEYFLTSAQQTVKEEIFSEIQKTPFTYFTISANAGTGKTLLMYDIAKDMIQNNKKIIIIHCGILNSGHELLRDQHNWNIIPIRSVNVISFHNIFDGCEMVFVDEAQRIRDQQLEWIIQETTEKKIPTIFSYDVKQYLKFREKKDIELYLTTHHPDIKVSSKRLTTKIRTNKKMASFITNLRDIGRSKDNLDYSCVSLDYFSQIEDLKQYLEFIQQNNWTAITFTSSQYSHDPYERLSTLCTKNAHDVIGQEFSKVVFVMDENFSYDGNKLIANQKGYYDADGMLYQIVTRVVDDLKIIVFNNPSLYLKILEIKAMGE